MKPELFTVRDAVARGTNFLKSKGSETARLDAELLVGHALGMDRLAVYMNFDRPLDEAERIRARDLIVRRGTHEPVAYILGFREFLGRPFEVTPAVLIPRPETELLVERAATELATRFPGDQDLRILELGVGSGAIAVSLCNLLPRTSVIATEISPEAAEVARRNAQALGTAARIDIRVQPDLAGVSGPFHAILANPPYVTDSEYPELMPDVRDFEPRQALIAGPDGLDVIRIILDAAAPLLAPGGFVLIEISPVVMEPLSRAAGAAGLTIAEVIQDYAGNQRHALLEPAPPPQ